MNSAIQRLQNWYQAQCDGDWEHTWGVHISTLDNPGWAIDVDLTETVFEDDKFEPLDLKRTEGDWIHATKDGGKFKIACGPLNLEEGLSLFLEWVKKLNKNHAVESAKNK